MGSVVSADVGRGAKVNKNTGRFVVVTINHKKYLCSIPKELIGKNKITHTDIQAIMQENPNGAILLNEVTGLQ